MPDIRPSAAQQNLISDLEQSVSNFSSDWDPVRGGLAFARADDLSPGGARAVGGNEDDSARRARLGEFLGRFGELFGAANGLDGLDLARSRRDSIGFTHLQFQQRFEASETSPSGREGIEVYGSKLAAHFAADGRLVEVQSSCYADPKPVNSLEADPKRLQAIALESIQELPDFAELAKRMKREKELLFPIMQPPRLVIYPWRERMLLAWATHGYGRLPKEEQEDQKIARDRIAFGQMFFDAQSGELFLFAPMRKGAENPTTGSGLGGLPLGGPFASRALEIVRQDMTSTYRLRNTTKARPIVTFDANANSSWVWPNIPALIDSNTIPLSEDTDGDFNWSRTAADTTDAERTASQQPEVDAHATVADIFDWYAAIGGRVGWDDNGFTAPLVPNQAINVVTHTFDDSAGTSRSINAFFDAGLTGGHWVAHLAFFDGDPTDPLNPYDYLAASKGIVAHEYQHAITDFSFVDGGGNPGLTYSNWFAAAHEGLSDVFGGLYSEDWWMGTQISQTGLIFRNLAFPRDTTCFDDSKFDHWDDRDTFTGTGARYFRGDILANAAYLMAQGGIHQRASRTPALIQVRSMGFETAGGRNVYKAARIYYRAVAEYLSNVGAATGIPANDENIFRTIRNGCVSAAIDLYGAGSREHKTTVLAWYAVGLHPVGSDYGPDCTSISWGADWWMSRPYVGLPSPDWSSVDLFINNGGTSEWNAQINVDDGGTPTQFENIVYFRGRNVGTAPASNVQVTFEYTKIGTGGATWLPMTDKDGNVQTLNLGTLAAGASNFTDAQQNTPPAAASVKWWIPPLEAGETVDHFCIRAHVFSISDINTHNNDVQSNIAYTAFVPGAVAQFGFFAGNDTAKNLELDLLVEHSLPRGWGVRFLESTRGVLKPGERRRLHAVIETPASAGTALTAPFDGRIWGELDGDVSDRAEGLLSSAEVNGDRLRGHVALMGGGGAHVAGRFDGTIDVNSGRIDGSIEGSMQSGDGDRPKSDKLRFRGCLRPTRAVNIAQRVNGIPVNGVTLQVQVTLPPGPCAQELPPTTTKVSLPGGGQDDRCLRHLAEFFRCLWRRLFGRRAKRPY